MKYSPLGILHCADINDCDSGNGDCSQICINNIGSFECSCQSGCIKQGFSSCIEINECEMTDMNCFHNCTNIAGSYFCSSLQGYMIERITECVTLMNAILRMETALITASIL